MLKPKNKPDLKKEKTFKVNETTRSDGVPDTNPAIIKEIISNAEVIDFH
jgi:hypothetical protein